MKNINMNNIDRFPTCKVKEKNILQITPSKSKTFQL